MTVQERVERGAALLDEHVPGWVDRIDLDDLDIENCTACVLGQVFADHVDDPEDSGFDHGLAVLGPFLPEFWDHGFCVVGDEYVELNAAWRDLISARRGAA